MNPSVAEANDPPRIDLAAAWPRPRARLLMYGVLLTCLALTMYLFGVLMALPRHLLGGGTTFLAVNEWIVWYSGVPLVLGVGLCLFDLFVLFGGNATVVGPILGVIVLYGIYNAVGISTPQYFQLIYGALIMGLVLFLPNGLISLLQRRGIDVP